MARFRAIWVLTVLALAASAAEPVLLEEQAPAVGGLDAITIPRLLSYQGRLADTLGRPVPDETYSVTFRLYPARTGGREFWEETQDVATKDGVFSVLLGSVTPVGLMPSTGTVYLTMAIRGGTELSPRLRIVSAAYAFKADTANYALAAPAGQHPWVFEDSVLLTIGPYGIARGGASNVLYGTHPTRATHINLGSRCTTGESGSQRSYPTVGGGLWNSAPGAYSTISGGQKNRASSNHATVGGGYDNKASGNRSTVGGGYSNEASGDRATVAGGYANQASGDYATVAGGAGCAALGAYTFVVGHFGGASFQNSASLNGQLTTASNQTRVGALSKASGTFTIDHPLDPHGRILNHYFIEGPEMRNIYDGETVLDASGRAVVELPGYFAALNRNPRVQLTGVGTFEVFLAEEVNGNRFTIGGPAGSKVYWQVTGERQDVSAEATRRIMPVEQPKTGELAGCMLDDDFLSGVMGQLEREGKAHGLDFRTAAGRERYRQIQQLLRESGSERGR